MTSEQRAQYFGRYWPAACQEQRWRKDDDERRRDVVRKCMAEIRGPAVDSSAALGDDEITALFCYLDHLGDFSSLDKAARWDDCKKDYRAYNRARQADWHEAKAYGKRPNRLDRDRFQGKTSAVQGPLDEFNPSEIYKRHLTAANRHRQQRKKQRVGELKEVVLQPARPVPVPQENPF